MGLLGPIRKKPKATQFLCMPFIREIRATETVYSQHPWNTQKRIPASPLCRFLIWFMHLNTCVREYHGSRIQSEEKRHGRAAISSNWFYPLCGIGGVSVLVCFLPCLMDYREREQQTPARQPQRHASPPFRAVCKSTVKFHFSNPFNQKQGNKASW